MQQQEENIVRKVLKNEITWVISIATFIIAFFTQVIIPINTIQLQLVSIQSDITTIKGYDTRITQNSNDIIVLKEQIKDRILK